MDTGDILRVLSLCVVLACTETLHGIARTVLLAPRVGKARAVKLSIVSGSLLAFGVCWLLVPPIGPAGWGAQWGLGCLVSLFMAGFDISLGLLLLRRPWRTVMKDFDPRTGNYLLYGLCLLSTYPWLVMQLQPRP